MEPFSTETVAARRDRFRRLHETGSFVIPNAWDVGSARILAASGWEALATTSSGHAAALGRMDQHVTAEELVEHVSALVSAVDLPMSVDAERCFADDPAGVAEFIGRLAATGAAGVSIEDYHPDDGIYPVVEATERVAAAATASRAHDMVLTARAENHIYGIDDLDDTVGRMVAFRDAGADVVYAPGLTDIGDIARVVNDVGIPVNVLLLRRAPPVPELAEIGVRRMSTGGLLAFAAYGALAQASRELRTSGTSTYAAGALSREDRTAALGD